jgi:4a-hydroxytetrahydrobiopterin dehydratase
MLESSEPGPSVDSAPARLSAEALRTALATLPEWRVEGDGAKLTRHFCFPAYPDAIEFVLKAARVAHKHGHYPTLHVTETCVDLDLLTPTAGGVTEDDVALATHMDACHFVHLATARGPAPSAPVEPGCGGGCGDGCA